MFELTDKQLQASILMVAGESISSTALQIDVSRESIYQWLKNDTFKAHLNGLRAELIESGIASIQSSVITAIQTINDLMVNSANDIVRLNAAKEILNRAGIIEALPLGSDDAEELQWQKKMKFE